MIIERRAGMEKGGREKSIHVARMCALRDIPELACWQLQKKGRRTYLCHVDNAKPEDEMEQRESAATIADGRVLVERRRGGMGRFF